MIDITFDFRSDAKGRDPDAYSPTLNAYHKILWSKELPNGEKMQQPLVPLPKAKVVCKGVSLRRRFLLSSYRGSIGFMFYVEFCFSRYSL